MMTQCLNVWSPVTPSCPAFVVSAEQSPSFVVLGADPGQAHWRPPFSFSREGNCFPPTELRGEASISPPRRERVRLRDEDDVVAAARFFRRAFLRQTIFASAKTPFGHFPMMFTFVQGAESGPTLLLAASLPTPP